MDELKKCPFCGLKAKYQHGEDWFEILCLCGFTFQHIDRQYQGESQYQAMVRSWNTRPLEDAQAAEIERLRGALEKLSKKENYIAQPSDETALGDIIYWQPAEDDHIFTPWDFAHETLNGGTP